MATRFCVVGGDAAGMSAASKAKRDAPDTDVVVLERGEWVSYGACGLPYYVEGRIDHLEDLQVLRPDAIVEERGIDLRRGHEAVAVDREARTVTVEADGERYEEPYDELLIATGGRATWPDVPGADLEGVFTVRNLAAGRALRNYLLPHDAPPAPEIEAGSGAELRSFVTETDPAAVAVLGANKIGLEMAEAFTGRGLEVHVFEESERVLPSFGPEVAGVVEDHLRERTVHLHLGTDVERIRGEDGRVAAVEPEGEGADATEVHDDGDEAGTVAVDVVFADLGVEPDTDLATAAGLETGPSGALARDEYGRTNDAHVYVAGDCAEKHHLLTGEAVHWPYALAANRAGRAVGSTVAGTPTPVGGIVGTGVMKTFDLEVARTGLLEREAEAAGFAPVSRTITTITRAHYYPGWSRIVVRLTADRDDGRLLGASIVGKEGAAHRINAVATALYAGMSVPEVGDLDFGYAPPFGPVWDPVLTAAKVLGDDLARAHDGGPE